MDAAQMHQISTHAGTTSYHVQTKLGTNEMEPVIQNQHNTAIAASAVDIQQNLSTATIGIQNPRITQHVVQMQQEIPAQSQLQQVRIYLAQLYKHI
jgi:hypothetical protein